MNKIKQKSDENAKALSVTLKQQIVKTTVVYNKSFVAGVHTRAGHIYIINIKTSNKYKTTITKSVM